MARPDSWYVMNWPMSWQPTARVRVSRLASSSLSSTLKIWNSFSSNLATFSFQNCSQRWQPATVRASRTALVSRSDQICRLHSFDAHSSALLQVVLWRQSEVSMLDSGLVAFRAALAAMVQPAEVVHGRQHPDRASLGSMTAMPSWVHNCSAAMLDA